jgi:hypothetical protein
VIALAKAKTPSYILTLDLKPELFQIHILEKRFEIARRIYNACLAELLKRYEKLNNDTEYKQVLEQPKSKDRNKLLSTYQKQYGLTEYSMHDFVKPMQHLFKKNIDSFTAQKIATRAWQTIEKLIFGEAEKVNFKRYGEMDSLEGKSNSTGIRYVNNVLFWNDLNIKVHIDKSDLYAQMALQNKIKYCRIQRKPIRGKIKYSLQLVLEGIPPIKINKETGEIRSLKGAGNVGIDIGTQTIAICSDKDVKLLELSPEIENIDKQKRILQRKLDRQRRANNPHKYNENGTIKKNNLKWIWSKNYHKTKAKLSDLQRKIADKRKQSHEKLANFILSLGNEIKVETMNYKGLQQRAKEATINDKTGKYNKKKRFGKSLANKAPSMLLSIIDRKLKYQGKELIKVNTFEVKASQYNHVTNEYIKKSLSERWNDFGDYMIQRDLYSAFLIMNVYDDKIDRSKCFDTFERFRELHNIEIERLKQTKTLASMGL